VTVQLSTLRISAELDAGKYAGGAAQKVAADQKMTASGDLLGASLARGDAATDGLAKKVVSLSQRHIDGYGSVSRHSQAIMQWGGLLDRGQASAERVQAAVESLNKKYGVQADTTMLAARGHQQLAAIVEQANARTVKSVGLTGFQVQNLSYQLNDVASGLLSGQSPFMIMAQQGGQVVQALQGPQGISGSLRAIGGSIAGFLGPVGLVGLGVAAVGTAAFGLYSLISKERRTVEESLEEHARLLGVVKDGYNDAATAAQKLTAQTREVTLVQVLQTELELRRQIDKLARSAPAQAASLVSGANPIPTELFNMPASTTNQYREFAGVIADLQASIAKGVPDFIRFRTSVAELAIANPQVRELALDLIKMAEKPAELQEKVAQLQGMKDVLNGLAGAASRAAAGLKALEDPNKTFADSLKGIIGMAPKANEALITQQKLRDLEISYNKGKAAIDIREISPQQAAADLGKLDQAYARARQEIGQNVTAYDTLIQKTRDRIEELQLEAQTADKTAGAVLKMKLAHDAERAAKSAGKPVTEEMREEWAKLGDEIARATQLQKLSTIQKDIRFDRATMFLSDTDVAIATKLRDVYSDIPSALASSEASALRFNAALKDTSHFAGDLGSTFLKDLSHGVDVMDALRSAAKKLGAELVQTKQKAGGNVDNINISSESAEGDVFKMKTSTDTKGGARLKECVVDNNDRTLEAA
jgi:hypothetical protein